METLNRERKAMRNSIKIWPTSIAALCYYIKTRTLNNLSFKKKVDISNVGHDMKNTAVQQFPIMINLNRQT